MKGLGQSWFRVAISRFLGPGCELRRPRFTSLATLSPRGIFWDALDHVLRDILEAQFSTTNQIWGPVPDWPLVDWPLVEM